MSGVLPHLDECHDDPESFLKAVRPDLWDWLVGWLQQQQLEAVAVSAPEGDDDGAQSLKQLGYEQLDNSSGSGASTAFDGGGASTALDGGDDALDGGDSKSKDGDTGQSQMLCNFSAATGSQSKDGDADPPQMLGNLEGARAGEDSQFLTRLVGQLTDEGGHFQADGSRQRAKFRKACGQHSALSSAGHGDGLGCGQPHFCRHSAGVAPRHVAGFFGAQRPEA